jgi:hypothetical protein
MSKYEEHFIPFVNRLDAKMKKGFEEYGDGSFSRPPTELIGEIEEELLDICGWSMIVFARLQDIKEKTKDL